LTVASCKLTLGRTRPPVPGSFSDPLNLLVAMIRPFMTTSCFDLLSPLRITVSLPSLTLAAPIMAMTVRRVYVPALQSFPQNTLSPEGCFRGSPLSKSSAPIICLAVHSPKTNSCPMTPPWLINRLTRPPRSISPNGSGGPLPLPKTPRPQSFLLPLAASS